jgi:hypothetical protein
MWWSRLHAQREEQNAPFPSNPVQMGILQADTLDEAFCLRQPVNRGKKGQKNPLGSFSVFGVCLRSGEHACGSSEDVDAHLIPAEMCGSAMLESRFHAVFNARLTFLTPRASALDSSPSVSTRRIFGTEISCLFPRLYRPLTQKQN